MVQTPPKPNTLSLELPIDQLGVWVENNYALGKGFESSTGFKLPNGATRSPDTSWVSQERVDALSAEQKQETFTPVCPDFVVELRSDPDTLKSFREKMCEYMDNGARLGWLLNSKNRRVEVYRTRQSMEVFEVPSELSREGILLNICAEATSYLDLTP